MPFLPFHSGFLTPETHLIPNILKSAISGDGKFTIFGDDYDTKDGTNVRDYVQVEDLIDAHILALKHMMETNKSDVFNLGTAQGYSNLEILNAAKKALTNIDTPAVAIIATTAGLNVSNIPCNIDNFLYFK